MMHRRTFVRGVAAGVAAMPFAARSQAPAKVPLIVWLGIDPLVPGESAVIEPLREGLRDLGYVEGKSLVFEYRHTNRRPERLPALIDEQIRQKVDVIFSARPDVLLAAMHATRSIPIVFAAIDDPVGAGVVESLAKPGRNVTGVSWDSTPKIAAKQFQLLRELVPGTSRLAVLWNPDIKGSPEFFREVRSAAEASAVALDSFEVRAPADFEEAFVGMANVGVKAVVILGSWFTWFHRERLAGLAARNRLPAIYGNRDSVLAGGLMSYGPSLADEFRRAAGYIDKSLRGAKPADLPVEQPTKFEFVINLKTAEALGLKIPQSLLMRADELIQ